MPDGVTWRGGRLAGLPEPGRRPRYAGAAVIALALHGAAALPFLLAPDPPPAPSLLEAVEIAPVPELAAPQPAETPSPAEAVAAAPPDPVQSAEPPPEPVQAVPPEEVAPPPPEPLRAAAPPPEPLSSAEPEPVTAEPPPEEVAALPPPPPPAPAPPRTPTRPAPRQAQSPPPAPRAAEAPPVPVAPAAPAPAPVRQAPPPSYVGALFAALERHKAYPAAARWRRAEGTALLRFAMRRDGVVAAWRIERSSGHEDLDLAVAEMIRRASPLPPPPPELAGDPVELTVPVRFSLR